MPLFKRNLASEKLGHKYAVVFYFLLSITSCGEDDKKKKDSNDSFASFEVDFSDAEKGHNFVVFPFVLGDLEKIEGGSSTVKFSLSASQTGSAKLTDSANFVQNGTNLKQRKSLKSLMSTNEIDHNLRTLINRFDPERGYHQGDWFWSLAKDIDYSLMSQKAQGTRRDGFHGLLFDDRMVNAYWESEDRVGPVEARYLANLEIPIPVSMKPFYSKISNEDANREQSFTALSLSSVTCPKSGDSIFMPNLSNLSEVRSQKIPANSVVEGEDYCIVYLNDPVSEPSKDNIKRSIERILSTYKKVVYKSEFETTSSGYVFKPIIVILDFKDKSMWPQELIYQVDGVFTPIPSKNAKKPMLFFHSNLNTMNAREASLAKSLFHSTMAHEIQHAVMDYFRVRKTEGVQENASIDEGLAHFMEDLFGFGEENFGGYVKTFLDIWQESLIPPLHQSESSSVYRGGAQALWYYLVSQKGGVSFTDGVASGGEGLKFIADVVTNVKGKGPKGLADKFGGNWTVTMGEFFVSLAVDNTAIPIPSEKFRVKDPQPIKDLLGNSKKFGMRFNNFGGLPAARNFAESKFTPGALEDEFTFYAAKALLYEVSDPSVKISFKASTDQGSVAVARVRVK